ncbi:hypothetical protein [Polynucleobacter sp. MWH-UH35A]|uniref:hypothetical protein n=1 Tax=Polynucleobacter sp. MWH-UH35A TaxID=1855619 RepID=UPI001BFE1DED|nr:hypothetical protein [Polynucleobacter sp. MWH-UH35A]QWD60416.1 hypothetical protein ICV36_01620 [Polynucleobacter sp. MWH-UH35A]
MDEKVESPFFYVPPLNKKDYSDRTWILLAESKNKNWFYDPYTLSEDEDGVLSFAAYIAPREKSNLPPFNATIVGPYLQKIDCFSNNQLSETFYAQNVSSKGPLVGDTKSVNGFGWIKIVPKTALAYVRSRLCGRKFIDDSNVNYFLYQEGALPAPISKKVPEEVLDEKTKKLPPVFYEVINNEVIITDSKKDVRQLLVSSYILDKYLTKNADYIFMANCQENSYSLSIQGQGTKSSGAIGAKDLLPAVAFNRACGNHGAYMKVVNKDKN